MEQKDWLPSAFEDYWDSENDNCGYSDEYWVTQDGRVIKITQLEDAHLNNILKLLERTHLTQSVAYKKCLAEWCVRHPLRAKLRTLLSLLKDCHDR
jgi:hypothetical protein